MKVKSFSVKYRDEGNGSIEGYASTWIREPDSYGDVVKEGDILFTYETDKASFECESTEEGELLAIFYEEGDEVPCLENVCAVGPHGEPTDCLKGIGGTPAAAEAPAEAAPDAILLDNSELNFEESVDAVIALIKEKTGDK